MAAADIRELEIIIFINEFQLKKCSVIVINKTYQILPILRLLYQFEYIKLLTS